MRCDANPSERVVECGSVATAAAGRVQRREHLAAVLLVRVLQEAAPGRRAGRRREDLPAGRPEVLIAFRVVL